ncbi:MAG: hypothetical protein EB102_09925, partial [Gammaproteobacteria bacterium]|nr:hypothetical protein [Gammaproteobacteria bacterium]
MDFRRKWALRGDTLGGTMSNASTPIRRGYFDGPTGQVHYRRCRIEGGEPLLLMHQSPLSSTQFEAVMPALAALDATPTIMNLTRG